MSKKPKHECRNCSSNRKANFVPSAVNVITRIRNRSMSWFMSSQAILPISIRGFSRLCCHFCFRLANLLKATTTVNSAASFIPSGFIYSAVFYISCCSLLLATSKKVLLLAANHSPKPKKTLKTPKLTCCRMAYGRKPKMPKNY